MKIIKKQMIQVAKGSININLVKITISCMSNNKNNKLFIKEFGDIRDNPIKIYQFNNQQLKDSIINNQSQENNFQEAINHEIKKIKQQEDIEKEIRNVFKFGESLRVGNGTPLKSFDELLKASKVVQMDNINDAPIIKGLSKQNEIKYIFGNKESSSIKIYNLTHENIAQIMEGKKVLLKDQVSNNNLQFHNSVKSFKVEKNRLNENQSLQQNSEKAFLGTEKSSKSISEYENPLLNENEKTKNNNIFEAEKNQQMHNSVVSKLSHENTLRSKYLRRYQYSCALELMKKAALNQNSKSQIRDIIRKIKICRQKTLLAIIHQNLGNYQQFRGNNYINPKSNEYSKVSISQNGNEINQKIKLKHISALLSIYHAKNLQKLKKNQQEIKNEEILQGQKDFRNQELLIRPITMQINSLNEDYKK